MRFAPSARVVSAVALLAFAAGCSATDGGATRLGPVGGGVTASAVDGSWVDESGVGVSTFANGAFSTTAMDNGNRLSEGTYRFAGANTVAITGTSLIRQSPIAFNCNIASRTQLNCTSADGNRFVLTRRA